MAALLVWWHLQAVGVVVDVSAEMVFSCVFCFLLNTLLASALYLKIHSHIQCIYQLFAILGTSLDHS